MLTSFRVPITWSDAGYLWKACDAVVYVGVSCGCCYFIVSYLSSTISETGQQLLFPLTSVFFARLLSLIILGQYLLDFKLRRVLLIHVSYDIFSARVWSKSTGSCETIPICCRSHATFNRFILTPSTNYKLIKKQSNLLQLYLIFIVLWKCYAHSQLL